MREQTYYSILGIGMVLMAFCVFMGIRENKQSWATFEAAHHCHDVVGGYVCADGAVKQ